MLAAIRSAAVLGVDAYRVTVEVDANQGLPQWTIVGLPAASVKESRERVGSALLNSGFVVPPRRITVNLAPADTAKAGTAFDLPIALAFLVATGQLDASAGQHRVFLGELGLDGTLRAVRGVLPVARHAAESGVQALVVPPANVGEAALVRTLSLVAPRTLAELVAQLRSNSLRAAPRDEAAAPAPAEDQLDFSDVVGQAAARRALEVAAAGGHNVALVGPPGAGKTMLARRLPGILPPLTESEALEVTAVHSVAGMLPAGGALLPGRPFRAPHHTISAAGLIGGGSVPRPGEASLAHLGVLFLDEMLEFPRHVLDSLRQPMEDGRVVIARAATSVTYPARFTLVGAMNPCPCGRAGDPTGSCRCSHADVARYRARLSGPLADRLDMHVTVGAIPIAELGSSAAAESSACIARRVAEARERQRARYERLRSVQCNAHVPGRWLDANGGVEQASRTLLAAAADRLSLSARGYHRVLKVARTIADLEGADGVGPSAVAEALRYRASASDATTSSRS